MADNLVATENPNAQQQAALKQLEEQRARVAASNAAIAKAEAQQAAFKQRAASAPGMGSAPLPTPAQSLASSGISAGAVGSVGGAIADAKLGTSGGASIPGMPSIPGLPSNPLVDKAKSATDLLNSKLGGGAAATEAGAKVQAQIQNLAEAKLAPSLFTTGPKDELLTVDVLGVSNTSIMNNLAGKLTGFGTSALESFRKNPGMLTDLTSMIRKGADGGFSFDTKALTDRVTSSLGGSANLFRNLSSGLQSNLTQGIGLSNLQGAVTQGLGLSGLTQGLGGLANGGGITSALYSKVEGTIGGVVQSFSAGNFKDARGIFDLVNQITGTSDVAQFFDVGAEANLLSGIFREAIQMGVPSAIDALVEKSRSDTAADYALRGNIEVAVSVSDMQTTSMIVERLGVNRVLADVPDAAERLVENYTFPEGTTRDQYAAEWTKLKNLLDALQPGWSTYNRNGNEISDLSLFSRASADALTLFQLQPEMQIGSLIANSYPAVQLTTQAKSMYPYALI